MKFVAIVVVLALAASTQASIVALAPRAGPSLTVTGPATWAAAPAWAPAATWAAPLSLAAPATWAVPNAWSAPAAWAAPAAISAPIAIAARTTIAAPTILAAPAAIAAPVWAHEGSYIAKTRGAVHVAPLAGHANSAASINLQPAPGTV